MKWIKLPSAINPAYEKTALALEPHEADVLVTALEEPLKVYQAQFEELDAMQKSAAPTTRQQDYQHLLLEEVIDMVSSFIEAVSNEHFKP